VKSSVVNSNEQFFTDNDTAGEEQENIVVNPTDPLKSTERE
jgi:hypothetical protein